MSYRVIQWSTGHVGVHALRGIIRHPDLELAGLIVHSDAKAGKDAGELAGLDPVGVTATTDVDAALATDADCLCYTATADVRPNEAVDDICKVLEAGINVVSTSIVPLVYPPAAEKSIVDRLQAACEKGGASCFTSGVDPGFANDVMPLTLLGVCERVDTVRVQEILNYATYDQPDVLFGTMGFGQPLDQTPDQLPMLLLPGILTYAWGSVVQQLAAGLGVELDGIEEWYERRGMDEPFDISLGTVDANTQAGLRFEIRGIVGGKPRIVIEHVTRLHDDVAPDWPKGHGQGFYRIQIEGEPSITCDVVAVGSDGDHNTGNLVITAMRVLNAVPAVVAAPPGLLSALDLPLITGKGTMPAS